jgi:predicted alpha/beta superfamily hydrolase
MRRHIAVLTAVLLVACTQSATELQSSAQALEIASTVTLRIHYPAQGRTLTVRGSAPLSWKEDTALFTLDGSHFYLQLTLPAGQSAPVQFRPYLDGRPARGAVSTVGVGGTVDVHPYFDDVPGQVVTLSAAFHSAILNNDRAIQAYLPPGYSENPFRRYPVLYMHDGRNLFNAQSSITGLEWEVDEVLDRGIRQGSVEELIVVAVDRTAQRISEYTPVPDPGFPANPPLGGLYLRMLTEELKPMIDAQLRTKPERGFTGIMGSSLGGLISAYAGLQHPDVFGRLGLLSPSVFWGDRFILDEVRKHGPEASLDRVYIDEGSFESMYALALADAYRSAGYEDGKSLRYLYELWGSHTETAWARRLPAALEYLYPGWASGSAREVPAP